MHLWQSTKTLAKGANIMHKPTDYEVKDVSVMINGVGVVVSVKVLKNAPNWMLLREAKKKLKLA